MGRYKDQLQTTQYQNKKNLENLIFQ